MISLLFWFLYDFIQQQQCMRYTHTYIHAYIHVIWDHWFLNVCWRRELSSQNNNTFSSIGRNAETLAPLQLRFWHLGYFSDSLKPLRGEALFKFFLTIARFGHYESNGRGPMPWEAFVWPKNRFKVFSPNWVLLPPLR